MHLVTLSDSLLYSVSKEDLRKEIYESASLVKDGVSALEDLTIQKDFEDLQSYFDFFMNRFKECFTTEQTRQMLYRLKRLTIERKPETIQKLQRYVSLGGYNSYYNKLVIRTFPNGLFKELLFDTIMHELLHMASTRNTKKGHLTGFELQSGIGKTLNEGYTEYVREKYFSDRNYIETTDWRVMVVKGLEYLVGEKHMENHYFDADLFGLLHSLEPYSTKEDLMKLVFLMDHTETTLGVSAKKYRMIIQEIARMNERKLREQLRRGMLSIEEYTKLKAMRVDEYRKGRIWSEKAKIIEEENSFMITEDGYTSPLYEKNTRMNSKNHLNFI